MSNSPHLRMAADQKTAEQIAKAATWLATHWPEVPEPLTRTLRQQFGLRFNDAVKAIAEAKRLREAGHE